MQHSPASIANNFIDEKACRASAFGIRGRVWKTNKSVDEQILRTDASGMRRPDKGVHRLAGELSSAILWDRGFGVEALSTCAERPILKRKVWQPIMDARIVRDIHALLKSQSSRTVEDVVQEIAEGWDRDPRVAWRKYSVTAKSSSDGTDTI
jgi:hypothetical protein